jgi:uncharacterized protein
MLGLLNLKNVAIASAILSSLVTGGAGYVLHRWIVLGMEKSQVAELAEQQSKLTKQCDADKQQTYEVSNAYQSKITALDRQLAAARRMRTPACVSVTADAPGRPDAAPGQGKPAGQAAGVARDDLIDLTGEGEKYRLQLLGLQEYVRRACMVQP